MKPRARIDSTLLLALAMLWLLASSALADDFQLHPSIAVGQEYNDNINETKDNRKSDFITTVTPGASMRYETAFWAWDGTYALNYRHYDLHRRDDEPNSNLAVHGLMKLVGETVFLDVSDTYSQVYSNVARGEALDTGTNANKVDQNILNLSPYIVLRPSERLNAKTGFRYTETRYWSGQGIDKTAEIGFLNLDYELSPRFTVGSDYSFTHLESEVHNGGYDQHSILIGPRYEYSDKSFVFAKAGPAFTNRQSGTESTDLFWSAGITHTLDTLVTTLQTSTAYSEDPQRATPVKTTDYSWAVDKAFDRATLGATLDYAEFGSDTTSTTTDKRKAGIVLRASRQLTELLTGTLGMGYERRFRTGSTVTAFTPSAGLTYLLGQDFTASLNYKYVDSDASGSDLDTYKVNRVILELSKKF